MFYLNVGYDNDDV